MKLLRMGMDGTCFCGFVPPTMKQFSFLTLLEFGINAIQLVQRATSLALKILFQEFYDYKSI